MFCIVAQNVRSANSRRKLSRPANCLPEAALKSVDLTNASLQGANLARSVIIDVTLASANLGGTNFQDATLTRSILVGVVLFGANLEHATLDDVDLSNADLTRAVLCRARLNGVRLVGAILQDCNLEVASLRGVACEAADLRRANLRGVEAVSTNLEAAVALDFANLDGVWLDFVSPEKRDAAVVMRLQQAASLEGVILPDGTQLPGGSSVSSPEQNWKTAFEEWCRNS